MRLPWSPSPHASGRALACLAAAALLLSCGDDDDDDGASDDPATSADDDDDDDATAGDDDDDDTVGDDDDDDDTTAGDDDDDADTTAGDDDDDADTTAGDDDDDDDDTTGGTGGGEAIELLNDGWFNNEMVGFQGGFELNECFASTFVPEPDHYPFVVDSIRMFIGGGKEGEFQDFSVALYSVDENNTPDEELGAGTATLSSIDADFNVVILSLAGIDSPVFDEGNFAIVLCHTEHEGFPSIARDDDESGLDFPDRNWIRFDDGTWHAAADLGLEGDWVLRSFIVPTK